LCNFSLILVTLENLSLVVLTYISSTEIYWIHEKSFIFFLIFAYLHYYIDTYIRYKSTQPATNQEKNLHRLKMFLIILGSLLVIDSAYWFRRHNAYCENGVYSIFALHEWTIVLLNVIYHTSNYFDVPGIKLSMECQKTRIQNKTKE